MQKCCTFFFPLILAGVILTRYQHPSRRSITQLIEPAMRELTIKSYRSNKIDHVISPNRAIPFESDLVHDSKDSRLTNEERDLRLRENLVIPPFVQEFLDLRTETGDIWGLAHRAGLVILRLGQNGYKPFKFLWHTNLGGSVHAELPVMSIGESLAKAVHQISISRQNMIHTTLETIQNDREILQRVLRHSLSEVRAERKKPRVVVPLENVKGADGKDEPEGEEKKPDAELEIIAQKRAGNSLSKILGEDIMSSSSYQVLKNAEKPNLSYKMLDEIKTTLADWNIIPHSEPTSLINNPDKQANVLHSSPDAEAGGQGQMHQQPADMVDLIETLMYMSKMPIKDMEEMNVPPEQSAKLINIGNQLKNQKKSIHSSIETWFGIIESNIKFVRGLYHEPDQVRGKHLGDLQGLDNLLRNIAVDFPDYEEVEPIKTAWKVNGPMVSFSFGKRLRAKNNFRW